MIFTLIYIQFIYAFNNILPHKPRLFHSSRNNTGIYTRFPQEESDLQLLTNIRENMLRKSLLRTLEDKNISEQYKLDKIKYFDFLFNTSMYVGNIYTGGLFLEHDDFRFD